MRRILLLCLFVAGATTARAQTTLDLPWCEVNPTASAIGPAKPQCAQLGVAGAWTEFGVDYDDGVNDPIVVTPGPSVPVQSGWSGNVATAPAPWVEASVVGDQRGFLNGGLMWLHRTCTLSQNQANAYCISLGQAYRALAIASELGPFVIPLPPSIGPDHAPFFLQAGYTFPSSFVKPDAMVRGFLEQTPVRWATLGQPGPHLGDTQCRTMVCDRHVLTPDQIGRILNELRVGLRESEVEVDVQGGAPCKYVPMCEFERPTE